MTAPDLAVTSYTTTRDATRRREKSPLVPKSNPQGSRENLANTEGFAGGEPERRTFGLSRIGAGEGIRTLDPDLGKDVL